MNECREKFLQSKHKLLDNAINRYDCEEADVHCNIPVEFEGVGNYEEFAKRALKRTCEKYCKKCKEANKDA